MAPLFSTSDPYPALDQIWPRLPADCQAQAIRLMAQLAYNFVAAHSAAPLQEAPDALATSPSQDST